MIDVIVPVYGGEDATKRCLASVLACVQRLPMRVVVVDDATPEPAIAAFVDALAADGRIELVRHAHNLGFVASVNRAMALHPDRDVVLLNSDTEVANDWLDRLAACAARDAHIATVTPFSNQATICSYPFEGWNAGVPGTLGLASLDRTFARANAGACADLPTAVGFCMYIKRACLDAIGAFDEERFGRGYGEENDFCMRARAAGWRSVVAADVFVFHEGGVSFAGEREALMRSATAALVARHPRYVVDVSAFIAADPLRRFRATIDDARRRVSPEEAECVYAERVAERDWLVAELRRRRAEMDAHDAETAKLREALAHAERLVLERDAEIVRLTAAFAHAEALALDRGRELATIGVSPLGKWVRHRARRRR
jgi:GT2 family glycosyltransferase